MRVGNLKAFAMMFDVRGRGGWTWDRFSNWLSLQITIVRIAQPSAYLD